MDRRDFLKLIPVGLGTLAGLRLVIPKPERQRQFDFLSEPDCPFEPRIVIQGGRTIIVPDDAPTIREAIEMADSKTHHYGPSTRAAKRFSI